MRSLCRLAFRSKGFGPQNSNHLTVSQVCNKNNCTRSSVENVLLAAAAAAVATVRSCKSLANKPQEPILAIVINFVKCSGNMDALCAVHILLADPSECYYLTCISAHLLCGLCRL